MAGIHGDTRQPGLPCHGTCLGLRGLQQFDKHLLGNVLGFVRIGQQQTTQVHHPPVMPLVELFVVGLCLRACLIKGYSSQAAHHEMDHRHLDHSFTGFRQEFVIFAQAPVAIEPSKRALHDPALWDHDEPFDGVAAFGDLQADRSLRPQSPNPIHQRSGIGSIRPDVPEPPILVAEDVEELFCPIAILNAGSRHHYRQDQPERIDEDMSLAAFDLFAGIVPTDPPFSVVLTD